MSKSPSHNVEDASDVDPQFAPGADAAGFAAHDPSKYQELVIKPRPGWIAIDWKEIWGYRELLYFLVWRDVKVKYKQAILGFAWAVLAPLISVSIYTLVFGRAGGFAKHVPPGVPYSVFIFAGMIPWIMLSAAIGTGGLSLVTQQNLLTKIYMPRLFIPTSVLGSSLVDMAINFVVIAIMMAYFHVVPAWTIVFVVPLILLTMMMGLGFALVLSAMTVTYRDLRFLIPFIVQVALLLSAVAFPSTVLRAYPELIYINPIAGLVGAWRTAFFNGWTMGTNMAPKTMPLGATMPAIPFDELNSWHFLYTVLFTIGLLIFGLFYFRRTERRFADIA